MSKVMYSNSLLYRPRLFANYDVPFHHVLFRIAYDKSKLTSKHNLFAFLIGIGMGFVVTSVREMSCQLWTFGKLIKSIVSSKSTNKLDAASSLSHFRREYEAFSERKRST